MTTETDKPGDAPTEAALAPVQDALRVFVAGFAFTRSATHPYLVETIAPRVWRLHDGPRRSGDYRGEEIVAHSVEPADLDALARRVTRNRYSLCYLVPDGVSDTAVRATFKSLGYRLRATETLMTHPLENLPAPETPFPVVRVETDAQAAALGQATRRRPLPSAVWGGENAPLRQYLALDGDTVIGRVGSVPVEQAAWCTDMFVAPDYRRRGIATALLARMLHDDKHAGATENVLLASHAGSKLYPTVGYTVLGTLLLYTPAKEQAASPEPVNQ